MENKEELNVTEAATEEVKAEETKEAVASEEKPARRRGRGRKQKSKLLKKNLNQNGLKELFKLAV